MGKRKLRFDQRKNYERKKRQARMIDQHVSVPPTLTISIPLSVYKSLPATSPTTLFTWLSNTDSLENGWMMADPLADDRATLASQSCMLYKMGQCHSTMLPFVLFTVTVNGDSSWSLMVCERQVDIESCSLLSEVPHFLRSVNDVVGLLSMLNYSKFCIGNKETKFLNLATGNGGLFKDKQGIGVTAFLDSRPLPEPTIRYSGCSFLLLESGPLKCKQCVLYRETLRTMTFRHCHKQSQDRSLPSSHTNYRYLTCPEKLDRLRHLHDESRCLQKKLHRCQNCIAAMVAKEGVSVDVETTDDLRLIMEEENANVAEKYPENSFQRIFWDQQREASSKSRKGMRWHPAMIKWCLYLCYQSSKAYELLRSSGCIQLPSQRTLRDYSHCVKSEAGFSTEVDLLLMQANNMSSCPEHAKLVILLLDEMYIREDLIYDKHSGKLIGFANLGSVSDHLLASERTHEGGKEGPHLAKTMMVFMVKGLFTRLRFPYAQFPCSTLSGDLLLHPFWQAVFRLERMEFKVMGATFDGASTNRRLVKLHDISSPLVHKAPNIYASDGRELFFFSDPPHLIKTARNCLYSKCRSLWRNGKDVSWQHVRTLYERDKGKATGLAMVPKLKFEHINLTPFAKMRVDLAAQVLSESVAKALPLVVGEEATETAEFLSKFDSFFDILNVTNFTNGTRYRKPLQHPYRHGSDPRLKWLKETFLPYLDDWEVSVAKREGFSRTEKKRMLLSDETLLGLRMTAKSFVDLVQYLFSLPCVQMNKLAFLSNNICQDPLENFFGVQRQRGGTCDNPNVGEFLKNTATLRVVNSFCRGPQNGNCQGSKQLSGKENTPIQRRQNSGRR